MSQLGAQSLSAVRNQEGLLAIPGGCFCVIVISILCHNCIVRDFPLKGGSVIGGSTVHVRSYSCTA